jgi:integrase
VLRVMAYTGLTPVQIAQLQPDHLARLDEGWIEMHGRKKGKGTAPRRRAVTDQGADALRAFVAAKAWGGVTSGTRTIVWQRAVARARVAHPDLHIPEDAVSYDLRHSFAELVLRTTGSLAVTAGLLGHLDERTTRRYVAGAIGAVERSAADQVSAALRGKGT